MKLNEMLPFRVAGWWLAWGMLTGAANGLTIEYCSSENTGSSSNPVSNIYQSNGACYQQCQSGSYAFGIMQGKDCWCSNYAPTAQTSVSNCNSPCPGYPSDKCGNQGQGLFGYIAISGNSPSGSAGGSSGGQGSSTSSPQQQSSASQQQSTSSEASSQDAVTSIVSQTVFATVTQHQTPSVVISYVTPSPSTPSTTSTSSSSPSPTSTVLSTSQPLAVNTYTGSPVVSTRVVTLSGAVITQTVTTAPTPVSQPASESATTASFQRKGLTPGATAAIVISVLVAIGALLAGAFFLWRRKQRSDEDAAGGQGTKRSPMRHTSVLSKTGLLSRTRPVSYGDNDDGPAMFQAGNHSVRHSMLFGAGGVAGEGVSPVSPLGSLHGSADGPGERRSSRPMVYDQRLNPSTLFANAEANGSRVSMQDQLDYSRPLGIANPDPRHSFESRNSYRT